MELSSLVTETKSSLVQDKLSFPPDVGAFHRLQHQSIPAAGTATPVIDNYKRSEMASASPTNSVQSASNGANSGTNSPGQGASPKHVAFELMFPESPQTRARLPLRVQIYPHDDTESIITTVKNFYGLYSGPTGSRGVSFEDGKGNTLIARYENFCNNMTVYVRVIEGSPPASGPYNPQAYQSASMGPQAYYNSEFPLQAPQQFGPHISRPASRTSRKRSPSPNGGRGRRSTSVSTNPTVAKGRSRSSKTRGSQYGDSQNDAVNGYSSGDGAPGSTSSKAKEQIGNTEISLENIVEGGRRKRAKFESSELPLFAPPQMPAATSNPSVSPVRRVEHQRPALPFTHQGQNPFTNPRPFQSPQSYNANGYTGQFATPVNDYRRHRGSIGFAAGAGVLPTPDPTVGSCMSEEDKDVALQLMRLGDMSNISHGRTSASTMDDTFSGKADAASSTGATSDAESESESDDGLPPACRQKMDPSTNGHIYQTTESQFMAPPAMADVNPDDAQYEDGPRFPNGSKAQVENAGKARAKATKPPKAKAPRPLAMPKAKKASTTPNAPVSPTSLPTQSRKPSITSAPAIPGQPGEDDQPDLSTKPRCQRCRKSKKGCDRQRPCGRCRDAGLTADQCISEDEGNGRKGRYGRHMGVPIQKGEVAQGQPTLLPAAPIAATVPMADKNKKRKR